MENLTKGITDLSTGISTQVALTAEEIAEREDYARDVVPSQLMDWIRRERNRLLAETDYLALADVTLTDEMRAYRQALRDLPSNTTDPANPPWPTKPS